MDYQQQPEFFSSNSFPKRWTTSGYLSKMAQLWIQRWALNVWAEVLRQPDFLDGSDPLYNCEKHLTYQTARDICAWYHALDVYSFEHGWIDALPSTEAPRAAAEDGWDYHAEPPASVFAPSGTRNTMADGDEKHPKSSRTWVVTAHGHRPFFTYDAHPRATDRDTRFCAPASEPSCEHSGLDENIQFDDSVSMAHFGTCICARCTAPRAWVGGRLLPCFPSIPESEQRNIRTHEGQVKALIRKLQTHIAGSDPNLWPTMDSCVYPAMLPCPPPYNEAIDYAVWYNALPDNSGLLLPQTARGVRYPTMPFTEGTPRRWWWSPYSMDWVEFTDESKNKLCSGWYFEPRIMMWVWHTAQPPVESEVYIPSLPDTDRESERPHINVSIQELPSCRGGEDAKIEAMMIPVELEPGASGNLERLRRHRRDFCRRVVNHVQTGEAVHNWRNAAVFPQDDIDWRTLPSQRFRKGPPPPFA